MEKDDDLACPQEDAIDIRLQTSRNLDLNVEQDCRSLKMSDVSAAESSLSSKDDSGMDGILKLGMEFESDEHAYRFYNNYAGLVGFSVRKDWINRSKVHGWVVSRKFTCSREGYRRKDKRDASVKKPRKETRTGCLARMIVTRQPNGKYRVTHFVPNHNHENVKPSNAKKLHELPWQGNVDVSEADSTNNLKLRSKLPFQLLGRRFGTPENLDGHLHDYDNYLRSGRVRDMNEGEAGRLLHYMQRQHFENPSFFHYTQLDIDDKISNIFWADDNMVLDYEHFGDVVCLDTTYRIDGSFRPFVQFIGLNHHKQVVIFGAAFLYDETVDSIKWLLWTFIQAMSGKRPKVILTDHDATIVQGIVSAFPDINHCVCALQMYQNTLKHLRQLTNDVDSFAKDFRSCIFDHDDEEDFAHAWDAMLEKFNLSENEWLRWMFREKEKWSLAYGRNTFFIDKNIGHLGETLSDNLRNYLNPEVDILQFFKHFESIINEQHYKEIEASHEMGIFAPRLMANVFLLKHASEEYTPKAFEVFQREYEKCLNVIVNKCSENATLLEYKAIMFGKCREYLVTFNALDETVSCSCMKFEYVGFLCCHALKVLDHHNIKVLPARFYLKRWTKDARLGSEREGYSCALEENTKLISATRYKDLCHNILKISARAAASDQAYEFSVRQLDEVMQGVEKILTMKPCEGAQAITSSSKGANASAGEQAEIFLDRNVIENQDADNMLKGRNEMESTVVNEGQLNHFNEQISNLNRDEIVQPSTPNTVTAISCHTAAYSVSPSQTLNPLTQGLYNFEASQEVQCMCAPPSLAMDQRPSTNLYQSQSFFSKQHNPPIPPQF